MHKATSGFVADGYERLLIGVRKEVILKSQCVEAASKDRAEEKRMTGEIEKEIEEQIRKLDSGKNLY